MPINLDKKLIILGLEQPFRSDTHIMDEGISSGNTKLSVWLLEKGLIYIFKSKLFLN